MSALSTVLRFMLIVVRNEAVQAAAGELVTRTASAAGRAATAAIIRAIRSQRRIND